MMNYHFALDHVRLLALLARMTSALVYVMLASSAAA
jgi:hypothetical protein